MHMTKQAMPVLFAGHGSPVNAIEDNAFTQGWKRIAQTLPTPRAILCVSAHWFTDGWRVCDAEQPRQVYDFYGFPKELYEVQYSAKGSPELAHSVERLLVHDVRIDNSWGIDHGAWSVLRRLYPAADVPIVQLSLDRHADFAAHFALGKALRPLREEGILLFGSGNVVHNLARIDWNNDGGFPWADSFDQFVRDNILRRDFGKVIDCMGASGAAQSIPTPEHFLPLLSVLGATAQSDEIRVFNDARTLGSLSMTGYVLG